MSFSQGSQKPIKMLNSLITINVPVIEDEHMEKGYIILGINVCPAEMVLIFSYHFEGCYLSGNNVLF
ncbi:hypothetical protein BEP19_12960 [Ammoniphilus oxalaticus]|uniref:Uncharacterized protein n=1 Tax=Ammoniphilus oxalaticus TaxID=66863 RepID=A0A419SH54_9BACL|nr:hypothetical protein BEP19_12960 [Ammoniphilus oxalaticus]